MSADVKHMDVFIVVEKPKRPTSWIRAGTASTNRDGTITVSLDVLPVTSGKLVIRERAKADPT